MEPSIYGKYEAYLPLILKEFSQQLEGKNKEIEQQTGRKLFEHFTARVKSPASMEEKCLRKELPATAKEALKTIHDSIGLRFVCGFVDDIYKLAAIIRDLKGYQIITEKDYIQNAKPNGYRSYHLIAEVETPYEDCLGNQPGAYFIEIQIRTLAMDSWASLEHQMKYKRHIKDPERIVRELKRCADELASCDLTMQTIRDLIQENQN